MVLVRKTELACRNPLDHDLWEAAAPGDAPRAPIISPQVPSPALDDSGFLPPVITQFVEDQLRGGDLYTDKVTSISMPLRPLRPKADQPVASADLDGRAENPLPPAQSPSVREARRRRQELKARELREQQARQVSVASRLLEDDVVDLPARHASAATEPARDRDDERSIARPPRRDTAPPSIPTPAAPPTERERRTPRWPVAKPATTHSGESIVFTSEPEVFERPARPPAPTPVVRPETRPVEAEPVHQMPPVGRRENETEELPDLRTPAVRGESLPHPAERPRATPPRSTPNAGRARPPSVGVAPLEPAIPPRDPAWYPPAGRVPAGERAASAAMATPLPVDPVDACGWLATVPRCCATCRDFKRVGDGERGWCTNLHAFGEQRMVESDSLACRSSLGVWWLPHDDLWLERADTTHHGRPTPLLDQIVQEGHLAGVSELEPRST